MNSITKLFDKYKTFEDNLKQERFWLFMPVYLVKTGLKYIFTISLAFLLLVIISVLIFLIFNLNEDSLLQLVSSSFLIGFAPSLIYISLFSRHKLSIHPLFITYIYFIILFNQSDLISYIIVFLIAFIITSLNLLFHLIIIKSKDF